MGLQGHNVTGPAALSTAAASGGYPVQCEGTKPGDTTEDDGVQYSTS